MKSRIILSTADFSANNIGCYVEVSDLTKKVLAKQTKFEIGSNESIALDTYLSSLVSGGFIGGSNPKLTVLMLPCLAKSNTPSELFFNVASLDENGYPKNWAPSIMTNYVQTSKGAYVDTSLFNTGSDNVGFKLSYSDFFNATERPIGFSSFYYLYDSNMTASNLSARNFLQSSTGLLINLSGLFASVELASNYVRATSTSSRVVNNKGFYGMSYIPSTNAADDNIIVNLNGDTETTITRSGTVNCGSTVENLNNNCILLQGNANNTARPLVSLIAFGHELTATELATLKGYVETLMLNLNI